MRIAGEEFSPRVALATVAIGLAGGLIAKLMGAPLPFLLGSVVAVGVSAVANLNVFGEPVRVPMKVRTMFVPVIGVSIGGAFTPEVLADSTSWWPTLAALVLFIPLVHLLGYLLYRRAGGLDPVTSYYSAVPGGLIEVIAMGEAAGADKRMLTMLQFLRLIVTILLVPLAFTVLSGEIVGSASGVTLARDDAPGLVDALILLGCGLIGYFGGRALRLPAFIMTGPILVSGAAHLGGLLVTVPPAWMVELTQLVMGVTLGTRFAGMARGEFSRAIVLSVCSVVGTMALAVGAALLMADLVDQPIDAVILAFAPGGVAEMSLVAVSLQISVVYVAAHHIWRILLSVIVARLFAHRVAGRVSIAHAGHHEEPER